MSARKWHLLIKCLEQFQPFGGLFIYWWSFSYKCLSRSKLLLSRSPGLIYQTSRILLPLCSVEMRMQYVVSALSSPNRQDAKNVSESLSGKCRSFLNLNTNSWPIAIHSFWWKSCRICVRLNFFKPRLLLNFLSPSLNYSWINWEST